MLRRVALLLVAATVFGGNALAHGPGSSQINLTIDARKIEGDWELNLRDARWLAGLDTSRAGRAAFDELRPHEAELRAEMLRHLTLTSDGQPCVLEMTPAPMAWDSAQSAVKFGLFCIAPTAPTQFGIHDELLFDRDPTHRAYFIITDSRVTSVGVMRTKQRAVTLQIRQFHAIPVFFEFLQMGFTRFRQRLDHLLFVVALLLPAALLRVPGGWTPRGTLGATARQMWNVALAFAASHSVTMAVSFFGLWRPGSHWVEIGLAVSMFAAAWNNLRPLPLMREPVRIALVFGTVHGFALAGMLSNLVLPRHARPLALGAFNLGVELAQLGVAALLLLPVHVLSQRRGYARWGLGLGSLAIAWLALVWSIQRALLLEFFTNKKQ